MSRWASLTSHSLRQLHKPKDLLLYSDWQVRRRPWPPGQGKGREMGSPLLRVWGPCLELNLADLTQAVKSCFR
jgi:hypothetical protein